jgi:transcriptional regulator with XRE-family HTH domain
MLSKEDLGERLRAVRREQHLTLKQLEGSSGFSATHISEIERGKTSPTIGVLAKLAQALSKEPAFFLEEVQLREVAVVRAGDRKGIPKELSHIPGEYLTPGIPGGRLNAYMLHLEPGSSKTVEAKTYEGHPGEEGVLLLSGKVRARIGEAEFVLEPGDAIHYGSEKPHGFDNLHDGASEIILVSTKRIHKRGSTSGATGGKL